SDYIRADIEKYMSEVPCPVCKGKRLKPEALAVTIGGRSIVDVTRLTVSEALEWVTLLEKDKGSPLSVRTKQIARQVLKEIRTRLGFLVDVGLDYLTVDRSATTLSGGEAQRIRLATQIGSGLMGVLYILDEPSIGLHQRDNARLIRTLVNEILYRRLAQILSKAKERPGAHGGIEGIEHIDKVIDIDQSPIGRTPRSNPATYTGLFTPIRELFAAVPDARLRGYTAGRFSFNVRGGRCEACAGDGII